MLSYDTLGNNKNVDGTFARHAIVMQHNFSPPDIPSQVFEALQASLRELKLTPIVGKGEANEVYLVDGGGERFILRPHPGEETVRT